MADTGVQLGLGSEPAARARYVAAAMQHANYQQLDDGTLFGRVPGLDGAWANAGTQEACAAELAEVIEEWADLSLRRGYAVPPVDGVPFPTG